MGRPMYKGVAKNGLVTSDLGCVVADLAWALPIIRPLSSGYVKIANWKMTIEILDFPIENCDYP